MSQPRRSCLKIKTLEESLSSCTSSDTLESSSRVSGRYSIVESIHAVRRGSLQIIVAGARRSSQLLRQHLKVGLGSSRTDLLQKEGEVDVSHTTRPTVQDGDNNENFLTDPYDSESASRRKERSRPVLPSTVKFGQVDVRVYDMSLSDNPAVSHGPAVQLDWEYEPGCSISVDEYETSRLEKVKSMEALKLTEFERIRILRKFGYDTNEIRLASQATNWARVLRQKTIRKINAAAAEGTLMDLDNHVPLKYKVIKILSCAYCRRQSKLATAVAY